jgi:methylenetetrahydrofolate dehydrogenase (NADP+) / methenyltetrahydrofolate cyclohydrolase
MTLILDGRKVAEGIKIDLKDKIKEFDIDPCLAVVLVGDNPASNVYVNIKKIACDEVGIISKNINLPADLKETDLLDCISKLNKDSSVHGILIQLPLPSHIDEHLILSSVLWSKDVDGFHPFNVGKLVSGEKSVVSCTPKGIIRLLKEYNIEMEGKHAVVVGRSNIVGKPIASLLLENNATVTICHSRTKNLAKFTTKADILIAAVGKPNLIKEGMVKEGVVIIDVGVNRVGDDSEKGFSLVGDVDFMAVKDKVAAITPVPGGVGPMTVAMLMDNVIELALRK